MGAPQQAPLATISRLFSDGYSSSAEPGQEFGVERHFQALLEGGQQQVPWYRAEKADKLDPETLCQYVGLVQETRDPEFYIGAYQLPGQPWMTSMYQDPGSVDFSQVRDHRIWERRSLTCMPLKGLSSWAGLGAKQPLKTGIPEDPPQHPGHSSVLKRPRGPMDVEENEAGPQQGGAKHARQAAVEQTAAAPQAAARSPDACRLLVYKGGEELMVNDVVLVVGILSLSPGVDDQDGEDGDGMQGVTGPSAARLVPRLHAVLVKKLDARCMTLPMQPSQAKLAAQSARQQALHLLHLAVGGDALAAEYLLLQLLARVHQRSDKLAVGSLSVNLTGCPAAPDAASGQLSPLAAGLQASFAALVPCTEAFPLSVPWLNQARLRPKQEHASGRWQPGGAQLPAHTQLLVDETTLQSGRLVENGINNLRVLKGLLDSQQVEYDCGFYQLLMPADLPVTVVSASTSLLKDSLDIQVPLRPTQDTMGACGITEAAAASDLGNVRSFLAHMRHAAVTVGPESATWVERSLQAAREAGPGSETKTMHCWLTIARLLALSHGEVELKEEHWQQMRHMEHCRQQRQRIVQVAIK